MSNDEGLRLFRRRRKQEKKEKSASQRKREEKRKDRLNKKNTQRNPQASDKCETVDNNAK